jgi:hypothetical protein
MVSVEFLSGGHSQAPIEPPTLRASYAIIIISVDNRDYHYLSQSEIRGGKGISRHLFQLGPTYGLKF